MHPITQRADWAVSNFTDLLIVLFAGLYRKHTKNLVENVLDTDSKWP